MNAVRVAAATMAAMQAHAAECYPDECCGMIVEEGGVERAARVTNIQNECHARDPERYPRTARIAYTMGPESVPILAAVEDGRLHLRAVYHSHPEHEAYFSAEDKAAALVWDEPSYPQAAQIVMSVRAGEVRYAKAFVWDADARDFVEVPLVVT